MFPRCSLVASLIAAAAIPIANRSTVPDVVASPMVALWSVEKN